MKTRTLLLLAVACGLAVLGAGVALMVRLANQPAASPPHRLGEEVRVGDATVVVHQAAVDAGDLVVQLSVGGVDDPNGSDGFALLSDGRLLTAASGCAAFTRAVRPCQLTFRLPTAAPRAAVLVLRRAEERATWQLAG